MLCVCVGGGGSSVSALDFCVALGWGGGEIMQGGSMLIALQEYFTHTNNSNVLTLISRK